LLVLLYRDRSSINKFQVQTCPSQWTCLAHWCLERNSDTQQLLNCSRMTGCDDHDQGIDHLPAIRPEDQLGLCRLREPVQGRYRDMVDLCMPWPWARKWSKLCCWNGFSPHDPNMTWTWHLLCMTCYDLISSLVNVKRGSRMIICLYCFCVRSGALAKGAHSQICAHSTCHGCSLCSRINPVLFLLKMFICIVTMDAPASAHHRQQNFMGCVVAGW
jgi:hypothetical protein